MKARKIKKLLIKINFFIVGIVLAIGIGESGSQEEMQRLIKLPRPGYRNGFSVEKTLLKRRSVRRYSDESLTLAEISQLLWAAQGITHPRGFRTAPSAGALYPLEVNIVTGKVKNLAPGVYKYIPQQHSLTRRASGDKRTELSRAALHQGSVKNAPAVIIFGAVYERTESKYGRKRGRRYVLIEVGHASQNVCLQAVSLGLGTVPIGAFHDNQVKKIINSEKNMSPLYFMPIGKLKKEDTNS